MIFINLKEKITPKIVRSLAIRTNHATRGCTVHQALITRMIVTTGVIFDMDGTLTEEHAIDFKAMYDRIGLVKRGDGKSIFCVTLGSMCCLVPVHDDDLVDDFQ